jgi:hypothetical protein
VAQVVAYETKAGKRYRVRYRTPQGRQTDKRGFKRKRDAEQWAATVEVDKLRGDYVKPSDARRAIDSLGPAWLARQRGHLKPSAYRPLEVRFYPFGRPKTDCWHVTASPATTSPSRTTTTLWAWTSSCRRLCA